VTFAFANVPGGGNTGPDVALRDAGAEVVLANGFITATIVKATATITSLKFRGCEMIRDEYYSMDGGKRSRVPSQSERKPCPSLDPSVPWFFHDRPAAVVRPI